MEFEGASNEVATIDNELYEWANELLDLLENNNVSRFLSLINTYNHKKLMTVSFSSFSICCF